MEIKNVYKSGQEPEITQGRGFGNRNAVSTPKHRATLSEEQTLVPTVGKPVIQKKS